jgi:hypothetical protein
MRHVATLARKQYQTTNGCPILLCFQGEGSRENEARDNARKDPDRIYRYATYNDLGGDIVKTPGNIREPLGGSSSRPYPR